jgi:hypothetical protein
VFMYITESKSEMQLAAFPSLLNGRSLLAPPPFHSQITPVNISG